MNYHELTNKEINKTRKNHQCAWCGQIIPKGEKSQYRAYIFDDFTSDYMHPECYEAMMNKPRDCFDDEGFMPGDYKRGSYELA